MCLARVCVEEDGLFLGGEKTSRYLAPPRILWLGSMVFGNASPPLSCHTDGAFFFAGANPTHTKLWFGAFPSRPDPDSGAHEGERGATRGQILWAP